MSSAVADRSLAGRVAGLGRTVLAALALTALASGLLLLLVLVQAPQSDRYSDGTRAVRLAHLAMVDQETGLRAFVVTRQDRFLEAYRRGRDALPGHNVQAREAFADAPGQLALLTETERRQRAWIDGWALAALDGLPEGQTPARSFTDGKTLFDAYRDAEAAAETSGDRLRAQSAGSRARLLSGGLLLQLGLLAAVAVVVRRRSAALRADVVAPVEDLVGTLARLQAGQLDARTAQAGARELREVGSGVDELAAALAAERRRVQELQEAERADAERADEATSSSLETSDAPEVGALEVGAPEVGAPEVGGHAERSGGAAPGAEGQPVLPGLRLLLADDDAGDQKDATLVLERFGQRADVVGDGSEAVQAVRSRVYDLVLMDLQMPHMDGLEATRRIRALTDVVQPRIVALTASALVEDRDACLEAGMDDHLSKPLRPEELAAALERARTGGPSPVPPPAAVEEPLAPVVDAAVLEALTSRLGDRAAAFRATLVQTWRTETSQKLDDLDRSAREGDRVLAARVCHAVKSGSAALGALRLAQLAGQLDARLRGEDPVDLGAAAVAVRAEADAADAAFG